MKDGVETKDAVELRKQRIRGVLLLLPVVVLVFGGLGYWLYSRKPAAGPVAVSQGINTNLPGARLGKEKAESKLSIYDQQKRDSVGTRFSSSELAADALGWKAKDGVKDGTAGGSASENAEQISLRLAEIRKSLAKPEVVVKPGALPVQGIAPAPSPDLARLEKLLKANQAPAGISGEDPQLKQLNSMLEKIQEIQHPEKVTAELKAQAKKEPDSIYKAFRAVVAEGMKVYNGSSVKLKLVDTLRIKGQVVPAGSYLSGLCVVTNQRLLLNIRNIRLGTSILPVDLTVYDLDGMPGINVPDAMTQDAVRSGSDNAIQGLELMPMDQGVTTQLAGAGVMAAKGLIGKKVRRVKVKLKGGYPLLLRVNSL